MEENFESPTSADKSKKFRKKMAEKELFPERGIETWFRLTSRNLHGRLQIVDTKAGMLITSNSLIISIVLGSLYTRLDDDPHLIFAVAPLIVTNMLSIVFAIIAAIPNKIRKLKKVSNGDLMSFENFFSLSEADYQSKINGLMSSGESLYDSIKSDIYQLGQKLVRKYKLIRISFQILLYGISFSVIMFGMCHLFF